MLNLVILKCLGYSFVELINIMFTELISVMNILLFDIGQIKICVFAYFDLYVEYLIFMRMFYDGL